ncbi:MAG: fasciclin domain-containing protein [Cyanobacteria bacterium J06628_3]
MANNASTSSNLPTIAGIVSQSGNEFDDNNQDFDILLEALETADLVGAVDDVNADLTVFAPTDAAFIELAQDFGYEGTDEGEAFSTIANSLTELGEGDPVPLLRDILLYHVSPEAKEQAQITEQAQVNTLLEGASFTVEGNELVDNEPDLSNPSFIDDLANIEAANGIIQGIDRVLLPIDIPGNEMTENSEDDILNGGTNGSNNLLQISNKIGNII